MSYVERVVKWFEHEKGLIEGLERPPDSWKRVEDTSGRFRREVADAEHGWCDIVA